MTAAALVPASGPAAILARTASAPASLPGRMESGPRLVPLLIIGFRLSLALACARFMVALSRIR